jgi:DNA polymerase III delta prime subunit
MSTSASTKINALMTQLSSSTYEWIPQRALVLESLEELQHMVGMEALKLEVIRMVKAAIINRLTQTTDMYHTVLTGDPGVGKTAVGMILCKILVGLNLVSKRKTPAAAASVTSIYEHPAYIELANEYHNLHYVAVNNNQTLERYEAMFNLLHKTIQVHQSRIASSSRQLAQRRERHHRWEGLPPARRALASDYHQLVAEAIIDVNDTEIHYNHMAQIIDDRHLVGATILAVPPAAGCAGAGGCAGAIGSSCGGTPGRDTSPDVKSDAKISEYFKIICGHDMVAEYVGQTGPKMAKLLESCRGKVVFVDEAYKLHDSRAGAGDFLGLALTMIIEWMDKHRDETTFIFAGYAEMLQKTIFRIQPGLKRRCQWIFNIPAYSIGDLFKIFELKRSATLLRWDPALSSETIAMMFEAAKETFTAAGGDMEQLLFQCGLLAREAYFDTRAPTATGESEEHELIITRAILNQAMLHLKTRNLNSGEVRRQLIPGMYT